MKAYNSLNIKHVYEAKRRVCFVSEEDEILTYNISLKYKELLEQLLLKETAQLLLTWTRSQQCGVAKWVSNV